MKKVKQIFLITIIFSLYYFLSGCQMYCLPIDLISKLLENMEKNPTKSGFILQFIYFAIVCYYEYPYDYWNSQESVQNKEEAKNEEFIIKVEPKLIEFYKRIPEAESMPNKIK